MWDVALGTPVLVAAQAVVERARLLRLGRGKKLFLHAYGTSVVPAVEILQSRQRQACVVAVVAVVVQQALGPKRL